MVFVGEGKRRENMKTRKLIRRRKRREKSGLSKDAALHVFCCSDFRSREDG